MLSKKENFLATIRDGEPDRFVQQLEATAVILATPGYDVFPQIGGESVKSGWGYSMIWLEGQPGPYPLQDEEHIVIKDIEHWRDYVHAPDLEKYTLKNWQPLIDMANGIDRGEQLVLPMKLPGIFDLVHMLMPIENALSAFYEYPDEMHELIDYIADWELRLAEQWCEYVKPDGVFQHDDWGTQASTFLAPEMFRDFLFEPYKRLYGFWKENTCEHLIIHHADCYGMTLVPMFVEMGIDVWQGAMTSNDIAGIIDEVGGKLSIMAGIDSNAVDKPDWTPEEVAFYTRKACEEYGKKRKYFIPCLTQGLPMSSFPGVYDCVNETIAQMSSEMF